MSTQSLSFTTLDVFTHTPYVGNPLSIITIPSSLKSTITQAQKQLIAREYNLSEVVFLHQPPPGTSSSSREIQIFTTQNELPLAGHPVVGTAHYVLKLLGEQVNEFQTKGGRIPLSIDDVTGNVKAVIPQSFTLHDEVTFKSALNGKDNQTASLLPGLNFIFVELENLEALAKVKEGEKENGNLAVAFEPERYLKGKWATGIIGTKYFVALGKDDAGRERYRTRMFAHVEDSGTGSACSALGCYLALRGGGIGERKFVFEQGVEMGRRNEIFVDVSVGELEDGKGKKIEKVVLSGGAVVVMEGKLRI